MKHTVRILSLNRPIEAPQTGEGPDGTRSITEYQSLVTPKDLEPRPEDHLVHGQTITTIPPGRYLFTQGKMPQDETTCEKLWRDAAEAMWLESLWLEETLKTDRILVRILSEEEGSVYQLFREIEGPITV